MFVGSRWKMFSFLLNLLVKVEDQLARKLVTGADDVVELLASLCESKKVSFGAIREDFDEDFWWKGIHNEA